MYCVLINGTRKNVPGFACAMVETQHFLPPTHTLFCLLFQLCVSDDVPYSLILLFCNILLLFYIKGFFRDILLSNTQQKALLYSEKIDTLICQKKNKGTQKATCCFLGCSAQPCYHSLHSVLVFQQKQQHVPVASGHVQMMDNVTDESFPSLCSETLSTNCHQYHQ